MPNANSAEISIASNVRVWHQKSPKSTFINNNNKNSQIEAKPAIIIAVIKQNQNHTNTQRIYARTHIDSFLFSITTSLSNGPYRKKKSQQTRNRIEYKKSSRTWDAHNTYGRTTKNTIIMCVVCCWCVKHFLLALSLSSGDVLLHTRTGTADRATRRNTLSQPQLKSKIIRYYVIDCAVLVVWDVCSELA